MLRSLGVLVLFAAVALYVLVEVDRRSTLALNVVEWQGAVGLPLWMVAGVLGLVLIGLSWPRRRRSALAKPSRPDRRPDAPLSASDVGWLAAVQARVRSLPLEPGATVEVDPRRTPPVLLLLDRVTPERARRSVEAFAELLASLPTPPRAAITWRDCPPGGAPHPQIVTAALRRYLPRDRFSVTMHEETVEIRFTDPDPRWA